MSLLVAACALHGDEVMDPDGVCELTPDGPVGDCEPEDWWGYEADLPPAEPELAELPQEPWIEAPVSVAEMSDEHLNVVDEGFPETDCVLPPSSVWHQRPEPEPPPEPQSRRARRKAERERKRRARLIRSVLGG